MGARARRKRSRFTPERHAMARRMASARESGPHARADVARQALQDARVARQRAADLEDQAVRYARTAGLSWVDVASVLRSCSPSTLARRYGLAAVLAGR